MQGENRTPLLNPAVSWNPPFLDGGFFWLEPNGPQRILPFGPEAGQRSKRDRWTSPARRRREPRPSPRAPCVRSLDRGEVRPLGPSCSMIYKDWGLSGITKM
jgi:hypothetical protein